MRPLFFGLRAAACAWMASAVVGVWACAPLAGRGTPSSGEEFRPAKPAPLDLEPGAEVPARWVLLPERSEPSVVVPYDRGRTAYITNGVRVVESALGSLEHARERLPGSIIDALELPDHLGGGFVFQSELEGETVLWRSPTWTGELSPLVRLPDRAEQVVTGFGKLYARLTDSGETVAIDPSQGTLSTMEPLPASPTYFDLLFRDDWFAVAHTDIRGVVATFDAGSTWHRTGLTEESASLSWHPDGVLVTSGAQKHLLRTDGSWTNVDSSFRAHPFADMLEEKLGLELEETAAEPRRPRPLGNRPLEAAVLHGWPLDAEHAVLAHRGSLGVIQLETGTIKKLRHDAYAGVEPCASVRLGAGVGFVCLLTNGSTGIFLLGQGLTLLPVVQLPAGQQVRSSGNGRLVIDGPCPAQVAAANSQSATPERVTTSARYCILEGLKNGAPAMRPVTVTGDLGAERVVSLSDGRVAIIAPPRLGSPGSLTFVGASGSQSVPLRFAPKTGRKLRELVESGMWLKDPTEVARDAIGVWVAGANRLVGVTINVEGVIEVASRGEADLRRTYLNGRRAVEVSSGEVAWQTLDYGKTWVQFDAPRNLVSDRSQRRHVLGCSEVGCSIGEWLRIGYQLAPQAGEAGGQDTSSVQAPQRGQVPHDASVPKTLSLRNTAYSQWDLTCYPNGLQEGPQGTSARSLLASDAVAPRRALATGFLAQPLASPTSGSEVVSSANRPFLGVPRPRTSATELAFDMGADGVHQFRAYVWGQDGEAWARSGAWVVRVADRFSVDGLWSTAPTRAPWANVLATAQLFGADRANRYSSSWQLSLDAHERAGVVRVSTTGTAELHFVEDGKATISVGNTSIGPLSGVAKVGGAWHIGTQEGARFYIYRLTQGQLVSIGDYPLGDAVHASLLRDVEAKQLALLVRAPPGTWHIYPITEQGDAEEPLFFDREHLNQEWPHCDAEERGWVVVSGLPLSRFSPSGGSGVLHFEGVEQAWKAEAVTARAIVSPSHSCVQALAARLASTVAPIPLPQRLPPTAQSIPLTLSDRLHDVRYGFQCVQ